MKYQIAAVMAIVALVSTVARAEPISLEMLLGDTQHAVGILQAEAALDGARHELQRDRGQSGWQLSGALGYGMIRNIVDQNRALSYPAAQGQVGFSYPLLGSSEQRQRAIDTAHGNVREKEVRLEEARRRAPLELESYYARYWGAQEAMMVIDTYLSSESELGPRLRLRQQKKLMLESRMIELMSGYASARAERKQLLRAREETRNRMAVLTGQPLADFEARPVVLPALPDSVATDAVLRHPDLVALRAQSDALQDQIDNSGWYGMDAAFSVMAAANSDQRDHQTGGTAFVGFNFSAPLSLVRVRREERQRLQSELESVRLQQHRRGDELNAETRAALDRLAQDGEAMDLAAQKTQASAAALRERQLRSNVFSEESIEALSQQLRDYTTQALSEIDARVRVWQANIEARSYLEAVSDSTVTPKSTDSSLGAQLAGPLVAIAGVLHGKSGQTMPADESGRGDVPPAETQVSSVIVVPQAPSDSTSAVSTIRRNDELPRQLVAGMRNIDWRPQTARTASAILPVSATPSGNRLSLALSDGLLAADAKSPDPGMAVYVWNSHDLIAKKQFQPEFWNLLDRLSIRRLLISLDGDQIHEAQARPLALHDFLSKARDRDVAVELLLGEPSWIEATQRQDLIHVILSLRGFEFSGLHLDIEPDQIYAQPLTRAQFNDWVLTLCAAAKASPWPTAVSVHPRYFRDTPYREWRLAQLLHDGGVREVALMIFSSDPQKVAAIARPILADAPEMRFRIAQSVEPQIDPTLSHARRSLEDFQTAMRELQQQMSTLANANGVVVQAWGDLMRMNHESEIR